MGLRPCHRVPRQDAPEAKAVVRGDFLLVGVLQNELLATATVAVAVETLVGRHEIRITGGPAAGLVVANVGKIPRAD